MSEIDSSGKPDEIGQRLVEAARLVLEPGTLGNVDDAAKAVVVAVLKQLDEEVWQAEEDNADWPCGGDFLLVAASLIPDDETQVADRG